MHQQNYVGTSAGILGVLRFTIEMHWLTYVGAEVGNRDGLVQNRYRGAKEACAVPICTIPDLSLPLSAPHFDVQ